MRPYSLILAGIGGTPQRRYRLGRVEPFSTRHGKRFAAYLLEQFAGTAIMEATTGSGAVQRLSDYQLGQRIVTQPQYRIYLARRVADPSEGVARGESVALQAMNPLAVSSPEAAAFEQQAARLYRLTHPGLPGVREAFLATLNGSPHQRIPCLILEPFEGQLLLERLRAVNSPLTGNEQWDMIRQVLDFLGFARDNDILPVRLSPSEIFASRAGTLKFLGTGLADEHALQARTLAGDDMAFAFAAPELVTAETLEPERALVFSFGVLAYRLLTGHLPFPRLSDRRPKGDCFGGVAASFRRRWRGPEVNRPFFRQEDFIGLEAAGEVLKRCIHEDPSARFSSLAEVQGAFGPLIDSLAPKAPAPVPTPAQTAPAAPVAKVREELPKAPLRQRVQNHIALAVGGSGLVLLLGAGWLLFRESPSETLIAEAHPAPARVEPLREVRPVVSSALPNASARRFQDEAPVDESVRVDVRMGTDAGAVGIEVAYRPVSDPTWRPFTEAIAVEPGTHVFRFSRPDYAPVDKQVEIYAGAKMVMVEPPGLDAWVPGPALQRLIQVDHALAHEEMAEVAREFARPTKPVFESAEHAQRYESLRQQWSEMVTQRARAARKTEIPLSVIYPKPVSGEPPVRVVYRQEGTDSWHPVHGDLLVRPGVYEFRFLRADYKTMGKRVRIAPGKARLEVMGPSLSEWQPSRALKELRDLEQALAQGEVSVLTERFSRPPLGPFKDDGHNRRLARVREQWFAQMLKK